MSAGRTVHDGAAATPDADAPAAVAEALPAVVPAAVPLAIVFADYDIAKPNSFIVLSIADRGVMELQLFFTKT